MKTLIRFAIGMVIGRALIKYFLRRQHESALAEGRAFDETVGLSGADASRKTEQPAASKPSAEPSIH